MSRIEIAGRKIGPGSPCFVLAEAGVNHNGDLELACELVRAAARSGADAVKFQTFRADKLAMANAPKAEYQQRLTSEQESQRDMLRRLELPEEAYPRLQKLAAENGILFLSSPFDEESADLLERAGLPAFKIPSGELTNHLYLDHIARKGKPIIMSTGMATLREVEEAVSVVRSCGNQQVAVLHCVSSYPAPANQMNLRAMHTLFQRLDLPVGFSDHSDGIEIPIAAVALGACVIEKHLTLDRRMEGPDHQASLEPADFTAMMRAIRNVEAALGDGEKKPAACEADCARVARKSLVAARTIAAGEALCESHVAAMRPGTGMPPSMLPGLLGRVVRHSVAAGEMLQLEAFA